MQRGVYSGYMKLMGEEHVKTLTAANNLASILIDLQRELYRFPQFLEVKIFLEKTIPLARRTLGETNDITLMMRMNYAMALKGNTNATQDDLSEAVTTLEETEWIARRVLGGAHPDAMQFELSLQNARAALRARETTCETPSPG